MSHPTPPDPIPSVRTLSVVPSCPICGKPLKGEQTVCSPKCRTKRARQKHEADRREQDAQLGLLLRTAAEAIQEARERLKARNDPSMKFGLHDCSRNGDRHAVRPLAWGETGLAVALAT
jgi:predicted nucleic acid-binding Zn ribbon protein